MGLFTRFKLWRFSKERTEFFSDAVFAIIITLLVLEIKVPPIKDHTSSDALLDALKEMAPKIISWVVSFFFVAVMWVQHHNVYRMATKIDYGTVWINMLFLLFLSFIPFPTALMGEYPHNRPAVLLFGLVATLASLLQIFLYRNIAKNHLQPHYDQAGVMKNVRRSFLLAPLLLVVASAVSFISLMLPYFIYALVPIFFLLPLDKEKTE
ncbi:MAG: TMEM175 family protein [Chitinophagales bacterium]